jgi:ATP-dependent helicase/nuclease subunit B
MFYTIHPSHKYLDNVVEFALESYRTNLQDLNIIMPDGVLCYYLKEVLKNKIAGISLLPQIVPIANMLSNMNKPLIRKHEQKLALANIITSYEPLNTNFISALSLSDSLISLFKELLEQEVDILSVDLTEDLFDETTHLSTIQDFLKFAFEAWQQYLAKSGKVHLSLSYKSQMDDLYESIAASNQYYIFVGFANDHKVLHNFLNKCAALANCCVIFPPMNLDALKHNLHLKASRPFFFMQNFLQACGATDKTSYLPIGALKASNEKTQYISISNSFEEAYAIASIVYDLISRPYELTSPILIVTENINLINHITSLLFARNIWVNNHVNQSIMVLKYTQEFIILADIFAEDLSSAGLINILKTTEFTLDAAISLEQQIAANKEQNISLQKLFASYEADYAVLGLFKDVIDSAKTCTYFADFLNLHIALFEKFCANAPASTPASFLVFLRDLKQVLADIKVSAKEYKDILVNFISDNNYAEKLHDEARVLIVKADAACMIDADYVIIPQFSDDVWPGSAKEDAWLSAPSRQKLGLEVEKDHIAHLYYNFFCLAHVKELYLLKSQQERTKVHVVSRFFPTIAKRASRANFELPLKALARNEANFSYATSSNFVSTISATSVELLLRNPYGFYVSKMLKLSKFRYLHNNSYVSEFGTFVHNVIELYTKDFERLNKDDLKGEFASIGARILEASDSIFKDFWLYKLNRIAADFIAFDLSRRESAKAIFAEHRGQLRVQLQCGRSIALSSISDRIEICSNNIVHIFDYKTGSVPSKQDVARGLSPQLIIGAIIAECGGFPFIPANCNVKVYYVKISSSGNFIKIEQINISSDEFFAHFEALKIFLGEFFKDDAVFLKCPSKKHAPKYNDYKHISRD